MDQVGGLKIQSLPETKTEAEMKAEMKMEAEMKKTSDDLDDSIKWMQKERDSIIWYMSTPIVVEKMQVKLKEFKTSKRSDTESDMIGFDLSEFIRIESENTEGEKFEVGEYESNIIDTSIDAFRGIAREILNDLQSETGFTVDKELYVFAMDSFAQRLQSMYYTTLV